MPDVWVNLYSYFRTRHYVWFMYEKSMRRVWKRYGKGMGKPWESHGKAMKRYGIDLNSTTSFVLTTDKGPDDV